MLGKLIKYELMAEWKKYVIIFGGIIFSALSFLLFDKGLSTLGDSPLIEVFSEFIMGCFVLLCFAAFFMVFVFATIRFYKNMFRDEGYLMHTLPVKPWEHIAAKLISVYVWSIAAVIVVIIGICIASGDVSWLGEFDKFYEGIMTGMEMAGAEYQSFMSSMLIFMAVMLILYPLIMQVYINFCIAVGCLFNTHKILMSIVTYIVVNIVGQVSSTIAIFVIGGSAMFESPPSPDAVFGAMNGVYIFTAVFSVIFYGAMLWGTNFIMKKKLNLE